MTSGALGSAASGRRKSYSEPIEGRPIEWSQMLPALPCSIATDILEGVIMGIPNGETRLVCADATDRREAAVAWVGASENIENRLVEYPE